VIYIVIPRDVPVGHSRFTRKYFTAEAAESLSDYQERYCRKDVNHLEAGLPRAVKHNPDSSIPNRQFAAPLLAHPDTFCRFQRGAVFPGNVSFGISLITTTPYRWELFAFAPVAHPLLY